MELQVLQKSTPWNKVSSKRAKENEIINNSHSKTLEGIQPSSLCEFPAIFLGNVINPGRLWQGLTQQDIQIIVHVPAFILLPIYSPQVPQVWQLWSKSGSECNSKCIPSNILYEAGNHHNHCENPQRKGEITSIASLQHNEDQSSLDDDWIAGLLYLVKLI